MIERTGEGYELDEELTVTGAKLHLGDSAPDFALDRIDPATQATTIVQLSDAAGSVRVLSVVPSLDNAVCHIQTQKWDRLQSDLPDGVVLYTVSVDLPYAQARWQTAENVGHWNREFVAEEIGEQSIPGQAERGVETRLKSEQSGFVIWEDEEPVCMVGYSGQTPDGIRIGPVYTPPQFRRRGYGSAAVAAVSQWLLDERRRFCVLFADPDNPTSNHIYREIGHQPVADIGVYRFSP